jgi:YidC/Oxa1 family membrane protein insertase
MHVVLATSWLDPIVNFLTAIVLTIDKPVNNLGWSLIILAALIRLVFWPLNTAQFKAFLSMQKIAPQLKRLQERYKDDRQKLQTETMELYKQNNVNPFAGCWPMLVQYPVIISVYYLVINHKPLFEHVSWLWIGSALSQAATAPMLFGTRVLAGSLAQPDMILILLYALSMYLSVRYVSMPATDPQQVQTQRLMAFVSPVMLGYLGWKYHWPSAMVLYWFAYNAFTMGQQFYMLRRYHQPLVPADGDVVADGPSLPKPPPSGNGVAQSKQARSARSKRRNKRGT